VIAGDIRCLKLLSAACKESGKQETTILIQDRVPKREK
jgi:hypothetical protein